MDFNDQTPREDFTIAGKNFKCPAPYSEGDEINAGEAARLNQDVRENVRNNLASNENLTQEDVDAYVAEYEFGERQGGGGFRTMDPVEREMRTMAEEVIVKALKANGMKLSGKNADVTGKDIRALALAYIKKNKAILEPKAQARVAEAAELPAAA